jgi:hypothetical protein
MTPPISAKEMRDRLLKRPDRTNEENWVQVLGAPGNRELLGLIGRTRPQSIGALSDLAGRAQPNVSRALSALVTAQLVTIASDGRRSIPSLTPLGMEKAVEFGLLDQPSQPAAIEPGDDGLFAVAFASRAGADLQDAAPPETDQVDGTWSIGLWLRGATERTFASQTGDLAAFSSHVLAVWWRLLYRRDAPMKLGEFALAGRADRPLNLMITSAGQSIEMLTRVSDGEPVELAVNAKHLKLEHFERQLIEEFIRPIVVRQRSAGRMDRPLQSALSRLEDSLLHLEDLAFCRTAGALGLSPYSLTDQSAASVRDLISEIGDEDARLDFASAVLADDLDASRMWKQEELKRHRSSNRFEGLDELRVASLQRQEHIPRRPWQRGRDFARTARAELELGTDVSLGTIDEFTKKFLGGSGGFATSNAAPGSMRGFQSVNDNAPIIVVEDEGQATRFVLARAIGDYLVFGNREACVADLYTDRQAVGRAFAAEFLAPGQGVTEMLDEGTPVYRVANHYGVSSEVVRRQYENFGQW